MAIQLLIIMLSVTMKTKIFTDKEMINMQTSNPITIGNKRVGSKTEAKPKIRKPRCDVSSDFKVIGKTYH